MSARKFTPVVPLFTYPLLQRRVKRAVELGHGSAAIQFQNADGSVETYSIIPEMAPEQYDAYLKRHNWSIH